MRSLPVHVHVYVYIYTYVIYIYIYMYRCMHMCVSVFLHVCMYVQTHVCMYVCMYTCVYRHTSICGMCTHLHETEPVSKPRAATFRNKRNTTQAMLRRPSMVAMILICDRMKESYCAVLFAKNCIVRCWHIERERERERERGRDTNKETTKG